MTLERIEHGHYALGGAVEVLAHAVLKQPFVDGRIGLGYAHALHEIAYGRGGIAAPAHADQRGHARVVPQPVDKVFLDEPAQVALGHDGVGYVESRELYLARGMFKAGSWACGLTALWR